MEGSVREGRKKLQTDPPPWSAEPGRNVSAVSRPDPQCLFGQEAGSRVLSSPVSAARWQDFLPPTAVLSSFAVCCDPEDLGALLGFELSTVAMEPLGSLFQLSPRPA